MSAVFLAILALCGAPVPPVRAQSAAIGIYTEPVPTNCNVMAQPYVSTTFYILAHGASTLSPAGVNGAEFRVLHDITGTEGIFNPAPNPASNILLGDPFGNGCNIAFPSCQDDSDIITLFSVSLILLQPVQDRFLEVAAHATPSNVNFSCALINLCDAPAYTAYCVAELFGCINDVFLGACTSVAVEERGWGAMKALYR